MAHRLRVCFHPDFWNLFFLLNRTVESWSGFFSNVHFRWTFSTFGWIFFSVVTATVTTWKEPPVALRFTSSSSKWWRPGRVCTRYCGGSGCGSLGLWIIAGHAQQEGKENCATPRRSELCPTWKFVFCMKVFKWSGDSIEISTEKSLIFKGQINGKWASV